MSKKRLSALRTNRTAIPILMLLLTGSGATAAHVSADSPPSNDTAVKGKSGNDLEEVVVTAQKRDERLQDVPISMSVLTGTELDKAEVQGVAEALNSVPGVATYSSFEGGGTQIIIRGVTAPDVLYDGPSTVAYYFDSVPFGLIRGSVGPDAAAYDLQQVEVLRGPQATLYGAGALAGVVRILSNDPNLENFDVKARLATSNTDGGAENYQGDAAVNIPLIEGKLALRAVVGEQDLSGWIESPDRTHVNNGEIHNYRLKVAAQPTSDLSIVLSAASLVSDFGAPSTSEGNGRILEIGGQPYSMDYETYGAKVNYDLPIFTLSSETGLMDFYNQGILDLGPYFAGFQLAPPLLYESHNSARTFSEELQLASKSDSLFDWTVGSLYRDSNEQDFQGQYVQSAPLALTYGEHLTSKSYALYGQFGQHLFDRTFEWSVGLRYFHDVITTAGDAGVSGQTTEQFSEAYSATTPRVVLTWYPAPSVTAYASYAEGYRPGWPQQAGVLAVVPNVAPVKPDTLRNYEIGAKSDLLDHQLAFDWAFYYMRWTDIQSGVGIVVNSVCCSEGINGSSASGIGTDFSVTARPVDGAELSAYISWNNLKFDDNLISENIILYGKGERVPLSPEVTAGVSMGYSVPIKDTGYAVKATMSDSFISGLSESSLVGYPPTGVFPIKDNSMQILRAWLTLDASEHWSVSLFGDNLNNWNGSQRGASPVAIGGNPDWATRIRPRTVGVQFEYHYR